MSWWPYVHRNELENAIRQRDEAFARAESARHAYLAERWERLQTQGKLQYVTERLAKAQQMLNQVLYRA
jgi:hypothetical protein